MNFSICLIVTLFCVHSYADEVDPTEREVAALKRSLPNEVSAVADRMVGCAHWSGEEPFDAARKADIDKHLKDLKCSQLDSDEAKILKKFKAKKASIEKVFEYSKIGPG